MANVAPASIEEVRDARSRQIMEYDYHVTMKPTVGPGFMDLQPGDLVNVAHPAGPRGDGSTDGWTTARAGRRIMRVAGTEVTDSKGKSVRLDLDDMAFSGQLATFHDSMRSRRSAGPTEDGVARFHGGQFISFNRASPAWAENPGDGSIVRYEINQKKITNKGLLLERYTQNLVIHSSFDNGITSWTVTAGSGSVVASSLSGLDVSQRYFDLSISSQCALITAGNPHTFATDIHQAGLSLTANAVFNVSVTHWDIDNTALNWWVQRASDSRWWNEAGQSWDVAVPANAFTVRNTRPTRDASGPISIGVSATTITLFIGLTSGGTVSRRNRVYFAQVEEKRWPTSPVVSLATGQSRYADLYCVTNFSGRRVWNNTRGSGHMRFTPQWSSAGISGEVYFPIKVFHDAADQHFVQLRYDGTLQQLQFQRRSGGVDYVATKDVALTAGTTYAIGWRWSSSADNELGYRYGTPSVGGWMDLCVDGVWGTQVDGAFPTELARSYLEVGHNNGQCVEGHMEDLWLRQYVMTDEQMERTLAQ